MLKSNHRIELKITTAFLYVIFSVYLLFPGFGGYETLPDWKSRLFYVFSIAYLVVMLLFVIQKIFKDKTSLHGYFSKKNLFQLSILAYILLTWISAFLSEYFPNTILGFTRNEGALTITIYSLCCLSISQYGVLDKKLIDIIAIATIIFGLFCILQFAGLNPLHMYPVGYNYYDANIAYFGQFAGSIGNADLVSAYASPISILLIIALYKGDGKSKILYAIAAIFGIIVMLKLWVKSGLLCFGSTLILTAPLTLNLKSKDRKTLFKIIIILIVLVLLFVYFVDVNKGMFHELHQLLHGNFNPNFGTGRIKIWSAVIKLVPKHFFMGYGPDTMIMSDIEPWTNLVNDGSMIEAHIDAAHNEYLNVLYHQGIFALIAYLLIILIPLIRFLKLKQYNNSYVALFCFVVAYIIQAFFNISSCISSIFFWCILGLLYSQVEEKKHK